jgi:hypothetical protein
LRSKGVGVVMGNRSAPARSPSLNRYMAIVGWLSLCHSMAYISQALLFVEVVLVVCKRDQSSTHQ